MESWGVARLPVAQFLCRAGAFFAAHGITIQRVLTDNAFAYRRSVQVRAAVAELGAVQRFTRPYRPQTNGKAERFNRTLLAEWAYLRPYASNQERTAACPGRLVAPVQPSPGSHRTGRLPTHQPCQQRPQLLQLAAAGSRWITAALEMVIHLGSKTPLMAPYSSPSTSSRPSWEPAEDAWFRSGRELLR